MPKSWADEAGERLQHMDWEAAVAWAAVAQVHATLANTAANAVGAHTSLEILAWRGAAATKAPSRPGT